MFKKVAWIALLIITVATQARSQGVFDPGGGSTEAGTIVGTITVTQGGTGGGSLASGGVVLGKGTAPAVTVLGISDQVLRIPGGGGDPAFGPVDLSQGAAVTGILANTNTTAASTNTASTIVLRDGSGNFTATTITADLSGNSTTTTALASNPSDCAANTFATSIVASGNLTCSAVAIVNGTTGTLSVARGGTGATTFPSHITATASLDFDLSASASQDLTITVTGSALGDAVAIGVPNASVTADTLFWGWVSATNTVTVRAIRTAGTPNPAAGTFRADVWQ